MKGCGLVRHEFTETQDNAVIIGICCDEKGHLVEREHHLTHKVLTTFETSYRYRFERSGSCDNFVKNLQVCHECLLVRLTPRLSCGARAPQRLRPRPPARRQLQPVVRWR